MNFQVISLTIARSKDKDKVTEVTNNYTYNNSAQQACVCLIMIMVEWKTWMMDSTRSCYHTVKGTFMFNIIVTTKRKCCYGNAHRAQYII